MAELKLLNGVTPSSLSSSDWKTWVLEDPAVWQDDYDVVTVPTGFMTDFASIPWVFRWWQTGGAGPQRVAAYFHDYLYSMQTDFNRRGSDRVFREVMQYVDGDGWRKWFRRWAMWSALRVGGWLAWRSGQKKFNTLGSDWRILK
jgi:hypothetical protein